MIVLHRKGVAHFEIFFSNSGKSAARNAYNHLSVVFAITLGRRKMESVLVAFGKSVEI